MTFTNEKDIKEVLKNFARPPAKFDDNSDLQFQIIDIQHKDEEDEMELDFDSDSDEVSYYKQSKPDSHVYTIRLFGVTKEGNSVALKIPDFNPFFYVKLPEDWTEFHVDNFMTHLKTQSYVYRTFENGVEDLKFYKYESAIITHETVCSKDLYGFSNNEMFRFLKLSFKNYHSMGMCGRKILKLVDVPLIGRVDLKLYESNLEPVLRFFHMRNIIPGGWINLEGRTYEPSIIPETTCQIEIKCPWNSIHPYDSNDIAPVIQASFDIETYSSDGAFPLPEVEGNHCIQIATTFKKYGTEDFFLKHIICLKHCPDIEGAVVESYETEREVLLAWKRVIQMIDPDVLYGYNIFWYDLYYLVERARLTQCFSQFNDLSKIKRYECDLKTKVMESKAYGHTEYRLLPMPGRLQVDLLPYIKREKKYTSYKLDFVASEILGERKFDLPAKQIFSNFRDGSAEKIKELAEYCIQDTLLPQKIVDKENILTNLVEMARVTCVPVDYLITRGQQIKVFSQLTRKARKMGYLVPLIQSSNSVPRQLTKEEQNKRSKKKKLKEKNKLISSEHQYQIDTLFAQINEAYRDRKLNLSLRIDADSDSSDTEVNTYYDPYGSSDDEDDEDSAGYEGATVLSAKKGAYFVPIAGLDFKSLYPGIMIDNNMCYTTLVIDPKYMDLPGVTYKSIEIGNSTHVFVQNQQGLLPIVLRELLSARSSAKKDMAKATDPLKKSIANGRQLALKVSCNSVYGFTGAANGMLPCKPIAASVTKQGRGMIDDSKEIAENKEKHKELDPLEFTCGDGTVIHQPYGCDVIYGDTDSIFCSFNVSELKKKRDQVAFSIKIGQIVSKKITHWFRSTNTHIPDEWKFTELEYEKVYNPLFLFTKKRYAGMMFTFNPDKYDEIDKKGIVLTRRDNCPIVKQIYGGAVDILMDNDLEKDEKIEKACSFVTEQANNLLDGKVSTKDLIISKSLNYSYKSRKLDKQVLLKTILDSRSVPYKHFPDITQSQVRLARKLAMRDPGNKPVPGDRLPYVLVETRNQKLRGKSHKELQWEKVEDPVYCDEHDDVKIDYLYYLENQVIKPVSSLFEILIPNPRVLFQDSIIKYINKREGDQDISKFFVC